MQSHQALAISQIVPAIVAEPVSLAPGWFAVSDPAVELQPIDFSPPLQTSVLRL